MTVVSKSSKTVKDLVSKYEKNSNEIASLIMNQKVLQSRNEKIQWEILKELYGINKGDIIRFKWDGDTELDAQVIGFRFSTGILDLYSDGWKIHAGVKVLLIRKKDKQVGANARYIDLERLLIKVYGTHEEYLKEVE